MFFKFNTTSIKTKSSNNFKTMMSWVGSINMIQRLSWDNWEKQAINPEDFSGLFFPRRFTKTTLPSASEQKIKKSQEFIWTLKTLNPYFKNCQLFSSKDPWKIEFDNERIFTLEETVWTTCCWRWNWLHAWVQFSSALPQSEIAPKKCHQVKYHQIMWCSPELKTT